MTPEEMRVLIKYHAKLLAKWVPEPGLIPKSALTLIARRILELINKLTEEED